MLRILTATLPSFISPFPFQTGFRPSFPPSAPMRKNRFLPRRGQSAFTASFPPFRRRWLRRWRRRKGRETPPPTGSSSRLRIVHAWERERNFSLMQRCLACPRGANGLECPFPARPGLIFSSLRNHAAKKLNIGL